MHTAEPKQGCCNKNIWLLSFTTQSNSGLQCCLVTMAHYWPYLCGHKNVWRSPPCLPSNLLPAFSQSFLQPHYHPHSPYLPVSEQHLARGQAPSMLLYPCQGSSAVGGSLRAPLSFITEGARKHVHTWALCKKHNALVCTVCARRTQQIQRWWAGGGRLEGCRLHAMKLIDSCKNRGTQSSAKETQYHTARWVGAPAFMRILLQSGISALPAVGEEKHDRVGENVLVCMRTRQTCSGLTSAMGITDMLHLWKQFVCERWAVSDLYPLMSTKSQVQLS